MPDEGAQKPLLAQAQRVEEASLNAWPALHQQLYDGWLLRFSRGFTKRANSVCPIYQSDPVSSARLLDKVRYCENLYAREGQPTVVRLTSLAGLEALDTLLAQRSYERTGRSLVLCLDLSKLTGDAPAAVGTSRMLAGIDQWLEIYSALTELPAPAKALHRAILGGIYGQVALAARFAADNQGIACGLGVLEAELVGLFDIFTGDHSRRQGQGRRAVWDLLHWGRTAGARYAYLQVEGANHQALALYQQLGFETLYEYWYRVSP